VSVADRVNRIAALSRARDAQRNLGLSIAVGLLALTFAVDARAQSAFGDGPPAVGGTGGLSPLPPKPAFGGQRSIWARTHRDASGRACIAVHGFAEAQKANPGIFSHMLLIANGCSLPIKLHVCYYNSDHCIDVVAKPYARMLETLGVFPHLQDFRWEYTESFN